MPRDGAPHFPKPRPVPRPWRVLPCECGASCNGWGLFRGSTLVLSCQLDVDALTGAADLLNGLILADPSCAARRLAAAVDPRPLIMRRNT